jgi:rod shape-determining protein MreC
VRFYLSAALIVLVMAVAAVSAHVNRHALRLLSVVTTVVAPLDRGAAYAVHGVEDGVAFVHALTVAARENEGLRQELARLRGVEAENLYLNEQNRRLRRLLHLALRPGLAGRVVAATVIARSPSTWFSTVVVDRGRGSGIRPGDAVLSAGGLVGAVLTAGRNSSVVLLITDPASGIPIVDVRSGDDGLLNGAGPGALPTAQFFSGTASVARGDLIATSGLGGGIPAGLMVGRVAAVERTAFGLVTGAAVEPGADLNALDVVLVVRP